MPGLATIRASRLKDELAFAPWQADDSAEPALHQETLERLGREIRQAPRTADQDDTLGLETSLICERRGLIGRHDPKGATRSEDAGGFADQNRRESADLLENVACLDGVDGAVREWQAVRDVVPYVGLAAGVDRDPAVGCRSANRGVLC